jgi:predicted lipid carrier protein YhbT
MFFERVLVMEGDTELGLVLKNTLDAIGPLWPRRPDGRSGIAPH